jgi:hypothetical protein
VFGASVRLWCLHETLTTSDRHTGMVTQDSDATPNGNESAKVVGRIRVNGIRSLNCAGSRVSINPGISARIERIMLSVLRKLAED